MSEADIAVIGISKKDKGSKEDDVMGLIEVASGNSVWRGMDYYNDKRVKSWKNAGDGIYEGIVSGSGDNKYVVHIDKNIPENLHVTVRLQMAGV